MKYIKYKSYYHIGHFMRLLVKWDMLQSFAIHEEHSFVQFVIEGRICKDIVHIRIDGTPVDIIDIKRGPYDR